jgi:tRNA1Val (adenine37-N6)-methyltransferase
MLAQRSSARVDAIDIHEASVQEAAQNFAHSPWGNKLTAIHSSLQDFKPEDATNYDLIVSNPPFFQNSLLPQSPQLRLAKHDVNLGIHDFVAHTSRLLNENGTWAIILPPGRIDQLSSLSVEYSFSLINRLNIYPKPDKDISRVVALFSKNNSILPKIENLVIRNETGAYTDTYKRLSQDYHAEGYL